MREQPSFEEELALAKEERKLVMQTFKEAVRTHLRVATHAISQQMDTTRTVEVVRQAIRELRSDDQKKDK